MAPIGLLSAVDDPFTLAADAAGLTHGHPSSSLAAGALALLVAELRRGATLEAGVEVARGRVAREPASGEVGAAAVEAAAAGPDPRRLAGLGEGWVAEEALAMAVYCALVAADFRSGLRLAVHHGGDSDSTGAITGNILGSAWGVEAIPADLLHGLEGFEVIDRVARDLHAVEAGESPDVERYPPF